MRAIEEVERVVQIRNKLGLHARAANQVVRVASRYKAEVFLEKDGIMANAKSIMGLLMLAATKGSLVKVRARGEDAHEALEAIVRLIEDRFGEAE